MLFEQYCIGSERYTSDGTRSDARESPVTASDVRMMGWESIVWRLENVGSLCNDDGSRSSHVPPVLRRNRSVMDVPARIACVISAHAAVARSTSSNRCPFDNR